jgi:hypothetical protein
MKKEFNPKDWLQTGRDAACCASNAHSNNNDFELVLSRIESTQTDITASYSDWRDIGFALSEEFGESGRNYFHRISQFYPQYSQTESDKQFDACLKSKGHGVTLKTFFHLTKNAGINISPTNLTASPGPVSVKIDNTTLSGLQVPDRVNSNNDPLPTLHDSVYSNLPQFLQEVCNVGQSQNEKDILLLGAIVTISCCVPHIFGYYGNQKVFANLFLFVTAPASSGKGILNHCKRLVYPVHRELRDKSQVLKAAYEQENNGYMIARRKDPTAEKPQKPPEKLLYIPANCSATGMFQLLSDNDGKGIIFETEGDTLSITFKSDYGNYSDGFRKAFHHETISYYRRTDRENVEVEKPMLSAVLSGTPNQVLNLIPEAENGLFSRFIFYYLEMKSEWKDVFARYDGKDLDDYFNGLGRQYFGLYNLLRTELDIEFKLTEEQQQTFNTKFAGWQSFYEKLIGMEYNATVRRLGLITFRMAMILSVLRILETGEVSRQLYCYDIDFNNALVITEVLIQHAHRVFQLLPQTTVMVKQPNRKEQFYAKLPDKFSRLEYVQVAVAMQIPDKTAQRYIAELCKSGLLIHEKQGSFAKITSEET